MSELRVNEITGEVTIISNERANRPFSLRKGDTCQFCLENTHLTPPTVYESKDKRIRIFDNKYPILKSTQKDMHEPYGFHEVVVDTNIHEQRLHQFSPEEIYAVFKGIKKRIEFFETDTNIKNIQVFKNENERAGASVAHSHWQIVATSFVPPKQDTMIKNFRRLHEKNRNCYYCSMIKSLSELTILETEHYIAYCPRASKFSHEINIIPKRHVSAFNKFTNDELVDFAKALKLALQALNCIHDGVAYNICMYSCAINSESRSCKESFHYSLQIIPRRGMTAGFEFSTDMCVNSVYPEDAAQELRKFVQKP